MDKKCEGKKVEEYNYTINDIHNGVYLLEADIQGIIYSYYKMNELWYLMNHNEEFLEFIHKTALLQDEQTKLLKGLIQLKKYLDNGETKISNEKMTQIIIDEYKKLGKEKQHTICNALGLINTEDIPKKEETITVEKILNAYENMTFNEKLRLNEELENRSDLNISLYKLKNALTKLFPKSVTAEKRKSGESNESGIVKETA